MLLLSVAREIALQSVDTGQMRQWQVDSEFKLNEGSFQKFNCLVRDRLLMVTTNDE